MSFNTRSYMKLAKRFVTTCIAPRNRFICYCTFSGPEFWRIHLGLNLQMFYTSITLEVNDSLHVEHTVLPASQLTASPDMLAAAANSATAASLLPPARL